MDKKFFNEEISVNEVKTRSTIIYKSTNTAFVYIIIEIALIILFVIGIYNILDNIKDAMSWIEYKTGVSFITNVHAQKYYATYNRWGSTNGTIYVKKLIRGIIFAAMGVLLTVANLKMLSIVKRNVVHIGTNHIEAWNHKAHLIAYYDKEIVLAVKNFFTVTIATQDERIDISHLFSVYNIVKIANRAIETKRNYNH